MAAPCPLYHASSHKRGCGTAERGQAGECNRPDLEVTSGGRRRLSGCGQSDRHRDFLLGGDPSFGSFILTDEGEPTRSTS